MKSNTKKAMVAQVAIGHITIEGLMLPNGDYAVAVPQIADLFLEDRNTASQRLKRLMGKGFQINKIKTEFNELKAVNIVTLEQFNQVILELVVKGNPQAIAFMRLLQGLSLQQLFADAFGQKFDSQDRQNWLKARLEGKQTRRSFTDAISDYISRHSDELSENRKQWLYTNASNKVNLQVFGVSAKKLRELGIDSRDNYSADQLFQVRKLEDVAITLIDRFDVEPTEAVKQAAERIFLEPCQA